MRIGISCGGLALLLVCAGMPKATMTDDISQRAKVLHFSSIVVDTHDDTPQRMFFEHFDLAHRDSQGNIDIPRMKDGGLRAIFFSIWCPASMTGQPAVDRAKALIDDVREQVRKHPDELILATTAGEVRDAYRQKKIAVRMGVEGGHMIDNDLGVLRQFAAYGVRYMTLTHTLDTDWADSSGDTPKHNGLTDFGKSVVAEMNRLGMMVDVSHVSDKTFWDALAVSKAPMIASHSSCRAICNAPRNMTDEMIKALAAKGGVIQINYHVGFLDEAYRVAAANSAELKQRTADAEKAVAGNEAAIVRADDRVAHEMMNEGKLPKVNWEEIVDHIDHAVKLVGADHVGLGSDFDGATMPIGMEDVSKLPELTEAMLRRGYSEEDIRKILGENTLHVMEEVEKVASGLQKTPGSAGERELTRLKASDGPCISCPRPDMSLGTGDDYKPGDVLLGVVVLPDGTASDIKVVRGISPVMDQRAVDTVKTWKLKPATGSDGQPVKTRVQVIVTFKKL